MASKLQKEFQKKKNPIGTKKEMGTKDIFKKNDKKCDPIFSSQSF